MITPGNFFIPLFRAVMDSMSRWSVGSSNISTFAPEIINGQLIDKITTYDEYLESDEMARKRFTYTITESEENDD